MDNSLVKISSNWPQIGGCDFGQAIQIQTADPDVFLRPALDDIVNEDKSILLSKGDTEEYCELFLQIYPHYKIQATSLVCNVAKIEIFQGPLKEYLETIYGMIVDEADDQFKTYRYDVEVQRSGITDLIVKFLTHSSDVCIFGFILYTAPNPNGITTLLPSSSCVNIENVQSILQNSSKTSPPSSDKYKQLLELLAKSKMMPVQQTSQINSNQILGMPTLEHLVKECSIEQSQKMNVDEQNPSRDGSQNENDIVNNFKIYIDQRFQDMEERLKTHLEVMEKRQMEKLDNILKILQNK